MKIVAIIPARYASARFPGKPLIDISGKTMIQRVAERVQNCRSISAVIVATDDERIYSHVTQLGVRCIMTSSHHLSGTDRCLEAYQLSGIKADAIINVQGDEPFVDVSQLEMLAALISKPNTSIATLAKRINDTETLFDTSKVKVVFNATMQALYFSRQAIPFLRNTPADNWVDVQMHYKHIGLYAYTSAALEAICALQPSSLELAESLEQLRWLENGYSINVGLTEIETPAIDTPEDLVRALHYLKGD
jgi:3-deoxy-manno-octulosonate cytidylyltransferase (CMP-KDO synthetase)